MRVRLILLPALLAACLVPASARGDDPVAVPATTVTVPADPVVVATFDTGTNPYHPCFRRPGLAHPRQVVPSIPEGSTPLNASFGSTYEESAAASEGAMSTIQDETLYHVPNTNLMFYGHGGASSQFVDLDGDGARASSQIACEQFGLAPNAILVILNWYKTSIDSSHALMDWVIAQPWIDVVHFNIGDLPNLTQTGSTDRIRETIESGKLVVLAAGNGVLGLGATYPMELSSYNGPAGSLIAGSIDNAGYSVYSNLDPHVVMDGCATAAADPFGTGETTFSNWSASARVTGYAARLVGASRAQWGHAGSGLVTIPAGAPRPSVGPLADGVLSSAELHEVIRKTADPQPHASAFDGGTGNAACAMPFVADGGAGSFYPKMGYGEVSEHTLGSALAVLGGEVPIPARPKEDGFYELSEGFREFYWAPIP